MDDVALAHVEAVTIAKLRRSESFALRWRDSAETGDGHSTAWITSSIELHFKYAGGRPAKLDSSILDELSQANGPGGMFVRDAALTLPV